MGNAMEVLFDGGCGMCSRLAAWGQRHARPGKLRFLENESREGQVTLDRLGLRKRAEETMVALDGERAFTESEAVVAVARHLRWPARLAVALVVIPRPLRDAGYRFVARRRRCLLPQAPRGVSHVAPKPQVDKK
ncbi:MAG: thiol-disulfide oxidoreductase DCC family protein [Thermoplasmatota archaeon]